MCSILTVVSTVYRQILHAFVLAVCFKWHIIIFFSNFSFS